MDQGQGGSYRGNKSLTEHGDEVARASFPNISVVPKNSVSSSNGDEITRVSSSLSYSATSFNFNPIIPDL